MSATASATVATAPSPTVPFPKTSLVYDDLDLQTKAVKRLRHLHALPPPGNTETVIVAWRGVKRVANTVSAISGLRSAYANKYLQDDSTQLALNVQELLLENKRLKLRVENYKEIVANARLSFEVAIKILVRSVSMVERNDISSTGKPAFHFCASNSSCRQTLPLSLMLPDLRTVADDSTTKTASTCDGHVPRHVSRS